MPARSNVVLLLGLTVIASGLYLRSRPERGEAEATPAPATQATPPLTRARVPSPEPSEVQPTLDRVFDGAVVLDPASPAFMAGDFNGDDATDLAVAVRPRDGGAVARITGRFATCSLQDALTPREDTGSPTPPMKVAVTDRLLAVVHGHAEGGWRSPEARQCYLVANAAGSRLAVRPLERLPRELLLKVYRTHTGDLLEEDRGQAPPRVVFWTGAAYARAEIAARPPARPSE